MKDIEADFLAAKLVIRMSCGRRAAALEAELVAFQAKVEAAVLDERARLLASVLSDAGNVAGEGGCVVRGR